MRETVIKSPSKRDLVFLDEEQQSPQQTPLIILAFGEDFSGKSRFGATAPEVIGCVPLDRKTRSTFERTARELKRRYLIPKQDLVREGNMAVRGRWSELAEAVEAEKSDSEIAKIVEATKKVYRSHINMVKEVTWALHDRDEVQTVFIDTFEQFYQDMLFAYYGRVGHLVRRMPTGKMYKDTSEANQETVDFVNSLSDKNLILTHRTKEEYYKDVRTGRMIWSGYKWLGHNCTLVIEHVKNKRYDPGSEKPGERWHYGLSVQKCTDNIELEGPIGQADGGGGLTDGNVNFEMLRTLVWPETAVW